MKVAKNWIAPLLSVMLVLAASQPAKAELPIVWSCDSSNLKQAGAMPVCISLQSWATGTTGLLWKHPTLESSKTPCSPRITNACVSDWIEMGGQLMGTVTPKFCEVPEAADNFCILGLSAIDPNGNVPFEYLGEDITPTVGNGVGGNDMLGIPNGGFDSYWRDSSTGARYLVHITVWYQVVGGASLGFRAVPTRTDIEISRVGTSEFAAKKWGYSGDLRADTRYELDIQKNFSLNFRLPKGWGGFTAAKIDDFVYKVTEGKQWSELEISGRPIGVSGSKILLRKPSKEWDLILGSTYPFTSESSGPSLYPTFRMADAAKYASGDRASGLQTIWSAVIYPSALKCGTKTTNYPGSSSSNALFQSATVPQFRKGFFELTVSDFHLKSDGTTNRGIYQFSINSKLARCLYRLNSNPITAQISITNENGKKETAITTSYERSGTFYVEATNFTFSKKKLRIKFVQKK